MPSVFLDGEHPAAAVIGDDEAVDESVVVPEAALPQLFASQFVGMEVDGGELVLQRGGVVGELRVAQAGDAQILLAVDEGVLGRKLLGEAFVDDGEGPVELRIGLFDVGTEGVFVHGRAVGESHQPVADRMAAAPQSEFLEMIEARCMARCSAESS